MNWWDQVAPWPEEPPFGQVIDADRGLAITEAMQASRGSSRQRARVTIKGHQVSWVVYLIAYGTLVLWLLLLVGH